MLVDAASYPRPGGTNEDFVLFDSTAAVVLDGAGMAPGMQSGCRHGVAWYVEQLGTFLHAEAVRADKPLAVCLATAIESTTNKHRDTCAVDGPLSPSATVSVARVRGDVVEWLVLGDCTVLVQSDGTVTAATDDRLVHVAPRAREALARAASGSPERQRAHEALVREERSQRNTQGGYWVAAADPTAASQALTGSETVARVEGVALLTDGAGRLVTTFHSTDWQGYMGLLRHSGPEGVLRQVREAEASDPSLSQWPRSKQYDDATIAHIRP
ncbi:protein phosphatase 2C domain-containing protein [Streptomyces flavochromogenes]|uniref:protein phosphatase 2C domain-containing protein n=1 Tax=Streptomyces flavochromogenes TaxID=68199 RepID=UPI0004C29F15|nr:protein phosphatase 2C domain-containing protein [Streptomyces flavochromogenes]